MQENQVTFDKELSPKAKDSPEISPEDKTLMSDIENEQHGPEYYDHAAPEKPNGPHPFTKTPRPGGMDNGRVKK